MATDERSKISRNFQFLFYNKNYIMEIKNNKIKNGRGKEEEEGKTFSIDIK